MKDVVHVLKNNKCVSKAKWHHDIFKMAKTGF